VKKLLVVLMLLVGAFAVAQDFPSPTSRSTAVLAALHRGAQSPASRFQDGKSIAFLWNQTGERRRELYSMRLPMATRQAHRLLQDRAHAAPGRRRKERDKVDDEKYDGGPNGKWRPMARRFCSPTRRMFVVSRRSNRPPPHHELRDRAHRTVLARRQVHLVRQERNVWLMERSTGRSASSPPSRRPRRASAATIGRDIQAPRHLLDSNEFEKQVTLTTYTTESIETRVVGRGYVGTNPSRQKVGVISVDAG